MAPKRKLSETGGEGTSKRAKKQKIPATPSRHSRRKAGEGVEVPPTDDIDALMRKTPTKVLSKTKRTPKLNKNDRPKMPPNSLMGLSANPPVTSAVPASNPKGPAVPSNDSVDPPVANALLVSDQLPSGDAPEKMGARLQDPIPPHLSPVPQPMSQLDLIQARLDRHNSQSEHRQLSNAGGKLKAERDDTPLESIDEPPTLLSDNADSDPKVKIEEEDETASPVGALEGRVTESKDGSPDIPTTPHNPSSATTVELERRASPNGSDLFKLPTTTAIKIEPTDQVSLAAEAPLETPEQAFTDESKIKQEPQD